MKAIGIPALAFPRCAKILLKSVSQSLEFSCILVLHFSLQNSWIHHSEFHSTCAVLKASPPKNSHLCLRLFRPSQLLVCVWLSETPFGEATFERGAVMMFFLRLGKNKQSAVPKFQSCCHWNASVAGQGGAFKSGFLKGFLTVPKVSK